jgi:protein-disulfide isomerase-like protein with CxxC motif
MKTLILFRPNSEHARLVIDYLRDFERQTGKKIPQMDVDSAEGADICAKYGIMSYPAILVTDNDGRVQQVWQGESFPTISELTYYA